MYRVERRARKRDDSTTNQNQSQNLLRKSEKVKKCAPDRGARPPRAHMSKRPRDAPPPVIDDPTDVPLCLRDLLQRWGLHDLARGVSGRLRCRLAPVCRTDAHERARIRRGAPALCASRPYAEDVFAAVDGRDGVEWATTSTWSSFDEGRGKVAVGGGWGAPGTHVLSNRDLKLVTSFGEVLTSERPLNLQMFHRDDTRAPVLASKLRWPAEADFFETTSAATPGRVLDDATRVSAAGAMTWWHLDDCGEFVCQVGLPESEARANDGHVVLGQTGKPVVKLFFFAAREDYAWIAQDAEMNATVRHCALDVFDTPDHYYPTASEMRAPSSAPLDAASPRAFDGVKASDKDEEKDDPCPTLWVAALEAGGPPLLSPPNVIHCVYTVRDCVMCEERRLSLAFMDEVLYFQRRAARWCEAPIFYAFVREDLADAEKAKTNAVRPLGAMMRDIREHGSTDDDAYRFARCLTSMRVLVEHAPEFYALDDAGVAEARVFIDDARAFLADAANAFAAKVREALEMDPRNVEDARIAEKMMNETRGAHALGDGRVCAVIHEKGRPRWGPVRTSKSLAEKDRKEMKNAIRAGTLDALLLAYRRNLIPTVAS